MANAEVAHALEDPGDGAFPDEDEDESRDKGAAGHDAEQGEDDRIRQRPDRCRDAEAEDDLPAIAAHNNEYGYRERGDNERCRQEPRRGDLGQEDGPALYGLGQQVDDRTVLQFVTQHRSAEEHRGQG